MQYPVKNTAASRFFQRQDGGIACAVSCLASAAKITGCDKPYDFFLEKLKPSDEYGTPNSEILRVAGLHLPVTTAGEGVYSGGLAVANIIFEGEGHFVLMLGEKNRRVIYYEPFHHNIVVEPRVQIEWRSGWDHDREWAINFTTPPGHDFDHWLGLVSTPAPGQSGAPPSYRPPAPSYPGL